MIKECNFKREDEDIYLDICVLGSRNNIDGPFYYSECSGEDNCVLYQIYKQLANVESFRAGLAEWGIGE